MKRVRLAPGHTEGVFDIKTFPQLVERTITELHRYNVQGILVSGHSGLLIAGALSYVAKFHVVAVRKDGDEKNCRGDHGRVNCILPAPLERWAWVDDFICSGNTFRNALKWAMAEKALATAVPKLLISYRGYGREDYRVDRSQLQIARQYNVLSETTIPHIGYQDTAL